jgi:FAD synthetase
MFLTVHYTTKGKAVDSQLFLPFIADKYHRYTSLGSTYNTFPNPALRIQSSPDCCSPQHADDVSSGDPLDMQPLASILLKSTNQAPVDNTLPANSSLSCIPSDLVPLPLNSAEMCMIETGECTMGRKAAKLAEPRSTCAHAERYRPAYELIDGTLERAGRGSGTVPTGNVVTV